MSEYQGVNTVKKCSGEDKIDIYWMNNSILTLSDQKKQ